ncbi:MAG TPA: ATP-binding cassette domain-containing protein [Gaiellaceae bacterium]|nr:ATP-binding cassette domain-containing protein [Gaiellaceae bacterium]
MPGSLAARDISKSYAAVQVLDHVSLTVATGDRMGIVGPNGIGKSTLLRVLAGHEAPDGGTVVASGVVGYLPQELTPRAGETVRGYLTRRVGLAVVERRMDELGARLSDEPELAGEYAEAVERFVVLGGDDFDARANAVLDDVGLGRLRDRTVASLSGGESARVALAAILVARFDVFLLDEPTNNLDFTGLERLEQFIDTLSAGVVLVSHDRAFLDRTVTRVVELEAETRRVREYAGTWSEFESARTREGARHRATGPCTRSTWPNVTCTRVCSRGAAPRHAQAARWPTGAERTHCGGRSRRRSSTSSGSRSSTSRGRRGICNCSSPRRRRRARLQSFEAQSSPWTSFG